METQGSGIARGFRVVVSTERATLPNGREVEIDVVHHPGAAAVVPFVSERERAAAQRDRDHPLLALRRHRLLRPRSGAGYPAPDGASG